MVELKDGLFKDLLNRFVRPAYIFDPEEFFESTKGAFDNCIIARVPVLDILCIIL